MINDSIILKIVSYYLFTDTLFAVLDIIFADI